MKAALAFFSVAAVALLALASAGTLLGGTRATPATALEYDFEVTVASGIPTPRPGLPACSEPDAGGTRSCKVTGKIGNSYQDAVPLSGAVRQPSTGRSGSLEATCGWDGNYQATVRVSSSLSVELTALSGSVSQSCSWRLYVASSRIVGSMNGGGSLALAGPASGAYTGTLNVSAVYGTGEFAGNVGTGTFTHRQEFPVPLGVALRSLTASHAEPSRLQLSLRKGKPRALVAAPAARLSAQTDTGLRVVSVPGSSCGATARKGTRSVRLAPALDRNRDGLVVVVPKLRPKLATGRWTIAVKCTYRVGGTAGTALTQVAVTVS